MEPAKIKAKEREGRIAWVDERGQYTDHHGEFGELLEVLVGNEILHAREVLGNKCGGPVRQQSARLHTQFLPCRAGYVLLLRCGLQMLLVLFCGCCCSCFSWFDCCS